MINEGFTKTDDAQGNFHYFFLNLCFLVRGREVIKGEGAEML